MVSAKHDRIWSSFNQLLLGSALTIRFRFDRPPQRWFHPHGITFRMCIQGSLHRVLYLYENLQSHQVPRLVTQRFIFFSRGAKCLIIAVHLQLHTHVPFGFLILLKSMAGVQSFSLFFLVTILCSFALAVPLDSLASSGSNISFVKDSGICETVDGVGQYSGYINVGSDNNFVRQWSFPFSSLLIVVTVVLVFRISKWSQHGSVCAMVWVLQTVFTQTLTHDFRINGGPGQSAKQAPKISLNWCTVYKAVHPWSACSLVTMSSIHLIRMAINNAYRIWSLHCKLRRKNNHSQSV